MAIRAGALALVVPALAGCGGGGATVGSGAAAPTAEGSATTERATTARAPRARAAETSPAPSAGTAGPERTVVAYLKASAEGDPGACRLFTERGLRRFLREFAPADGAGALEGCEALFELVGQGAKKTVRVGGRELTADQVEDVPLAVKRRPGARYALVSGPGAHARLVLVDGRWLIDAVKESRR